VAVVDDELDLVLLFKDALSDIEGVNVLGFTDPRLALEHFMVNQANYEAVISDFRMPSMNGIELLKKIKEINPTVKTLLVSAFEVEDELFQECLCVDKMLQKPIHISTLIHDVGMAIDTVKPQKI
jgi:DNA-binding NtrC family response regulator